LIISYFHFHFHFFFFLANLQDFTYIHALIGNNIRPLGTNELTAVVCISQYNLQYDFDENIICTGTLISMYHILTSNHCLVDITNTLEIKIIFHSPNIDVHYFPIWWLSYDQWATASQININTMYNDIAIIRVNLFLPNISK
jgi:hypothetical protein